MTSLSQNQSSGQAELPPARRKLIAAAWGLANHLGFGLAVTSMAVGLHGAMSLNVLGLPSVPLQGVPALLFDCLLLLQFPLLHSWLATKRGRRALVALAPKGTGQTLSPTTYTTIASLQLLLTFSLWAPLGSASWAPSGYLLVAWEALFVSAWIFLLRALVDGGFGLQTGLIGWRALWQDARPRYPDLPTGGLFARCRQPIYLGFAMLLWTGPIWTTSHLLLALAWTSYCLIGPRHKEQRFEALYGDAFRQYRSNTPYILPRIRA